VGCLVDPTLGSFEDPVEDPIEDLQREPPLESEEVAVCLFGINRSLRWTVHSIREHIFAPLEAHGAQVRVFFHTYSDVTTIKNERSGEGAGTAVGSAEEMASLLAPRLLRWRATSQAAFDDRVRRSLAPQWDAQCDAARQRATASDAPPAPRLPRGFDVDTARNVLRQLNSLQEVTRLWEADGFSAVLYLRPDLRVLDPLNAHQLLAAARRRGYFLTPLWSTYGGCNDRIAGGSAAAMARFGHRLDLVGQYLAALEEAHARTHARTLAGTHPRDHVRAHEKRPPARGGDGGGLSGTGRDGPLAAPGQRYGLHPESFLKWCLLEAHPAVAGPEAPATGRTLDDPPLRRVPLRLRAVRVRATGLVDHRDWALVPRQDRAVDIAHGHSHGNSQGEAAAQALDLEFGATAAHAASKLHRSSALNNAGAFDEKPSA